MRGIGEQLSAPLALPPLPALLVNPGVPLPTRDVFAALRLVPGGKPLEAVPRERGDLLACLAAHGNDLTQAAVACAPVVGEVLAALAALPGVRLARMSGSGPTCFALFNSPAGAQGAARALKAANKAWWVHAGIVGA